MEESCAKRGAVLKKIFGGRTNTNSLERSKKEQRNTRKVFEDQMCAVRRAASYPLTKFRELVGLNLDNTGEKCVAQNNVEQPRAGEDAGVIKFHNYAEYKGSPKMLSILKPGKIPEKLFVQSETTRSNTTFAQSLRRMGRSYNNSLHDEALIDSIRQDTVIIPKVGFLNGLVIDHLRQLAADRTWVDAEVVDYIGFLAVKNHINGSAKVVFLPHNVCYYLGHNLKAWIEDDSVKGPSLEQITAKTDVIYFVLFLDDHFVLVKHKKINFTKWIVTVFDPLENQIREQLITIGIELVSRMIEARLKSFEPGVKHCNNWQRTPNIKTPGGNSRDCGPGIMWALERELTTDGTTEDYKKFLDLSLKTYRHKLLVDLLQESNLGLLIIQKFRHDGQLIANFVEDADDRLRKEAASKTNAGIENPAAGI